MVAKSIKFLIKTAVSAAFVIYLIYRVEWPILIATLKKIDIWYYIVSSVVASILFLILALKHSLLVKNTPFERPIKELVKINLVACYYALLFPSAVVPETVRWVKITSERESRFSFIGSMVLERSTFLFVIVIFSMVPLGFYSHNTGIMSLGSKLLPFAVAILLGLCVLTAACLSPVVQIYTRRLVEWLANRFGVIDYSKWFSHESKIPVLKSNLALSLLALSIVWQLMFVLRVSLLFSSAGVHLRFIDVTWMSSMALFVQLLPVTYAGLGLRESALAFLVALIGYPPEIGVTTGLFIFSQMLIFAVIGGILEFFEK